MRLKIHVDLDYETEGLHAALLAIEAAELPDQHVVKSALDIQDPVSVVRVPADEGLGVRDWVQIRDRLTATYSAEVEIDRPVVDLPSLSQVPVHELPGEVVKFLMPSRYCQSDMFEDFVSSEFGSLTGGALVAVMRDWIEEKIEYVRGASDEKTTVVDTFVKRQGICRDYAHLMTTFARAAQIPARCVSVYAPDVEPPDFHAVAEVYLEGGWRLVDATGMAAPDTIVRIGAGADAANIPFLILYGPNELKDQKVSVKRA